MTKEKDVKNKSVNPSEPDDDKGQTVPKSRLDEVIVERNVLRREKENWTTEKQEMVEELAELGDFKKLRELTEEHPEFAQAIAKTIHETFGDKSKVSKQVPERVREAGRTEESKGISRLEQEIADMKIEKLFDKIGVKDEEIEKLTKFCEEQEINMANLTLLEMAYNKVFPKTEEEDEEKGKEPDSSTVSGLKYGDKEIKTIRDAIDFALEQQKSKK